MDKDRSPRVFAQSLILSGLLAGSSAACLPPRSESKLDSYRTLPSIASDHSPLQEQQLLARVTERIQIDVPHYFNESADVRASDSIKSGASYFVVSYVDGLDTDVALLQVRAMEGLMYPGQPGQFGVVDSQTGRLLNTGPRDKAPKQEVFFYFLPASENNPPWATNSDPCVTRGAFGSLPAPTSVDGCQAVINEPGRAAVIIKTDDFSNDARGVSQADRKFAQANFLASVVQALDAQGRQTTESSGLSQAILFAVDAALDGTPFEMYRNAAMMSGISYITESAYGFIFHAIHIEPILSDQALPEDAEPGTGGAGALGI